METKIKTIFIVIAAVMALTAIGIICSYFKKGNRKGRAAEKRVAKVLNKLGKGRNVRIMKNVYLPLYRKTCEIDHLVFGRFGILVVETKGVSGTISGNGKYLVHNIGSKKHKLYNPEFQNKTHIDNVIHHLKKGGFDSTPVYGAVVFADDQLIRETRIGMNIDEFKEYFKKIPESDCNQDVLLHYFEDIRVTSPVKKLLHKADRKDRD